MTDEFPLEFFFFGRPSVKKLEGGEGLTIRKGKNKLTIDDDNPFGLTRSTILDGEDLVIPSGFQLVVHGEFTVELGATVTIEDGGALIVL